MAMVKFRAPPLPIAGAEYNQDYMAQLIRALALYFNQLDSKTPVQWEEVIADLVTARGVQFDTTDPLDRAVGRLRWNTTDGTLDLGMGFPGVNNQIGQETYFPPLYNNTGSLVEDGAVIGITGYNTAGGGLTFVKYLSDGSMPNIRAIAVVTSDMANGVRGLATRTGYVRNLNTTGSPFGQTWTQGQTIYASSTVAGGMTNVEPVAPALSSPIGLVATVHATDGIFLVAASYLQQPVFYGAFSDTTDQPIAAVNTPQTITFNTTDASSGVTIGSPTSRIITSNQGIYNFQFSLQIESSIAASRLISIWPRINGVDVPNSAGDITIKSNSDVLVPAWNFVLPMAANDYFELVWACNGNSVLLSAHPVQTSPFNKPAIPSIILTVSPVNQ